MIEQPDTPDLHALLHEASQRLKFAGEMLKLVVDQGIDTHEGYAFAVIGEVIADVSQGLYAASGHLYDADREGR